MLGVKRALILSTGDKYFALVVNFATLAAVSRLLSPGEIGVSVIGMAIVGIALSAREFTSSSFLIKQDILSSELVRSAFTAMLILTIAVSSSLALAAPWLAAVYGEENLVPYLRVISVCLLIDLIPQQILALLRREMAFGRVALINVVVTVTGAFSTISLALLGFSYMSFAWAWLASVLASAGIALVIRPHLWMFKPSFRHCREIVSFGGWNGATIVIYKLYEAVPYLVLGRMASPVGAAMLQRCVTTCQLPDKIVLAGAASVLLPAFATEARQDRGLKQPYLKGLELITVLQWPALVTLALLAYPVVDFLFGSQWRQVAPLVQVMAVATLFTFSFELNYPVLVAVDAIEDVFRRALLVFPVSAVILAVASLYGVHAVVWSMIGVMPFNAIVSLHLVRKRISMTWSDLMSAIWRSGLVAVATAVGPLSAAAAAGFTFDMSLGQAIIACCLAGLGWLVGLYATSHPLLDELANSLALLRRVGFEHD